MDAGSLTRKGPSPSGKATEVTVLLRNADRLLKENNCEGALAAIAQARALDPQNPYAVAYEERVRSLIKAKTDTGSPAPVKPAAGVSAPTAPKPAPAAAPRPPSEDDLRKKEGAQRQKAIDEKINGLLKSVEQYRSRKEYQWALEEISRAALLSPDNPAIFSMREQVTKEMDSEQRRGEEEKKRWLEEQQQRKQLLVKEQAERLRKEKEERETRLEEAKRKAQQEKVQQYLARSRAFLTAGKFEAAMNELTFIVVIDPLNDEASSLSAQIKQRQEQVRREEEERARQREEEQRKRREAIEREIERQCAEAMALAEQGNTSDALLVITRAYVIDPASTKVRDCEVAIMAVRDQAIRNAEERRKAEEEEERRMAEEELERMAREEQERLLREQAVEEERRRLQKEQIHEHLGSARFEFSQQRYESALAEVALAFLLDPFDEDIKALEEEILAAQGHNRTEEVQFDQPAVSIEEGPEAVQTHITEAHRLIHVGMYDRALEELTRAFIIDPLNEEVQVLEREIDSLRFASAPPETVTSSMQKSAEVPGSEPSMEEDHLARAEECFDREAYEEALAEVALGLLDHPNDTDLMDLERKIWEAQNEARRSAQPEKSERELHAQEERARRLQLHLLAADEFQKQNDFTRALDEVAKAYVIDPLSPEIKKLEVRIRQNQSRQSPVSANALKLVYPNEKAAGGAR